MDIILKLQNEDELINLSDLLLPLNYFNNFISELEHLEILSRRFQNEENVRRLNENNNFNRLFPTINTIRIRSEYVKIKKIKKESPTILELVLNISPYVESMIFLLVEFKGAYIEDELYNLMNKIDKFNKLDELSKINIIKYIIMFFKLLLSFIVIFINQ